MVQHLRGASEDFRFLDLNVVGIELLEARRFGEQLLCFIRSQAAGFNPGCIESFDGCVQIVCLAVIMF